MTITKWICEVCKYVHDGDEPPDFCPICGVGPDKFRKLDQDDFVNTPDLLAGPPRNLEDVRDMARRLLKGVCGVYPQCDGHQDRICQRQAYGGSIGMGGAGSGQSFAANVQALAGIELNSQLVGNQFEPNLDFDFFGVELDSPIMGASTSGVSRYNPILDEGVFSRACVDGCREAGTISWRGDTFFYTEDDNPALDSIAMADGFGVPIFKPRTQDALKRLIGLAEKLGCPAVGVDLDGCGSTNMIAAGQPVYRKTPYEIEELVRSTSLPFIAKGIMDPNDAEVCVQAGAKVIAVSNHGGRVLDSTPGVADILPLIAQKVAGRALITADGGVRTGYDVFKMLALGADAVLIGRDLIRAAVGGGKSGVRMQMDHLNAVLTKAMLMTGCPDLSAIGPKSVSA